MNAKTLAAALLGIAGVPACALAVTIRVPLQQPTIQAGVNAAVSGDTVLVAPGIYRGDENKRVSFYGRDIKLLTECGPTSTIIDVEGFAEPDQAFRIEHGETPAAVIDGFTIRNGYLEIGGGAGMSIGNSSPTVRNCIFVNNWMGSAYNDVQGGAVAVENGEPTFTYCSFINNEVRYFGPPPGFGANGGAVYCRDSSLQFTSCTFQSNAAFGVGYSGGGGAVSCVGSSLTVDDCSFIENSADLEGGALSVSGSDVTLDNTTFVSNVAGSTGSTAGGIFSAGSILQVTNCTFSGNAAGEGGGLFFTSSNVLMEKTIVAFSEGGGAIRCVSQGPDVILRCCDLFGNTGGDWTEPCIAAQFGSAGNISLDPLFCNATGGDFHLDANSPCSPENSPQGCGLIGALGVACSTTDVQENARPIVRGLQVLRNPARGTAEFEIVPTQGHALEIFGVSGRLIERLPLLDWASRATWQPRDSTPPGVYFAALRSSKETRVVKFILLSH